MESKSDWREMEDASVLLLVSPVFAEPWKVTGGGPDPPAEISSLRPERSNLVKRSTSYCCLEECATACGPDGGVSASGV